MTVQNESVRRNAGNCCYNHCCQEPFVYLWGTITSSEVRRYGMILNIRWTLRRVLRLFSVHFLFFRWPVPLQHLEFHPAAEGGDLPGIQLHLSVLRQRCSVGGVPGRYPGRHQDEMAFRNLQWVTYVYISRFSQTFHKLCDIGLFKRAIWIPQCGQYEHTTKVELVRWLIVTDVPEWGFWHELLNDAFATIAHTHTWLLSLKIYVMSWAIGC